MGTSAADANGYLRSLVIRRFGREALKEKLKKLGFDTTHWVRVVAYRETHALIEEIEINKLDVLEIAPGDYWRQLPFKSYTSVSYPDFDVCKDVLDRKFDLIIADQVFEHVKVPWRAACNVLRMLQPGGHFLIIVPFLLKVHGYPTDCTRWTENGLKWLLEDAGFADADIRSGSWGNRQCATANFRHGWRMFGWGKSLKNEQDFPVMTWALAKRQ
jgi:SAM-dependent methyltransferase